MRATPPAVKSTKLSVFQPACKSFRHLIGTLLLAFVIVAPAFAQSASSPAALEQAIAAEFDAADGDQLSAAKKYLQAAKDEKRADYAERAARLALYARDFDIAEQAAEVWLTIKPEQEDALQTRAFAELALGKTEAYEHIRLILLQNDEKSVGSVLGIVNPAEVRSNAILMLKALQDDPELLALAPDRGLIPIALRLKQNKLGLKLAQNAVLNSPESSKAWLWRGLAEIAADDKAAAQISYAKALGLDPENVPLRLGYVQILNDLKRVQEIDATLRAAPLQTEPLLRARIAFASANSDKKALKTIAASLRKPNTLVSPSLRTLLRAQIYELMEDSKKALSSYAKVAEGAPEWADAQLRRAVLLAGPAVKKPKLAAARKILQNMQASTQEKAQTINAYLLEAELLSDNEQYQEADRVLSLGLQRFPDDAGLLYSRALAGLGRKDIARMEADFRQIIALDPENANAWNSLGYSLLTETDRTEEAMALIERAYQLDPKSGAITDSLGWGFFKMGQVDQAIYYLREAYKLEPEGEIAAHLGEALHTLGADSEAIQVLSKAKAKYPDSAPLQETIERLKLPITSPKNLDAESVKSPTGDDEIRGHEHRE